MPLLCISQNADFYFTHNGKKLDSSDYLPDGGIVHMAPRLPGGKGGLGSMLKTIGVQIEKAANSEGVAGRRIREMVPNFPG